MSSVVWYFRVGLASLYSWLISCSLYSMESVVKSKGNFSYLTEFSSMTNKTFDGFWPGGRRREKEVDGGDSFIV